MTREELEDRRFAAVRLLRNGMRQCEVACHLGVSRMTVSRWVRRAETGELKTRKAPGRPSRVPMQHLIRIWKRRRKWTGPAFAKAIFGSTGVLYSRDCSRLLKRIAALAPRKLRKK